jgi:catechol 2,3-dioxygenase-like lactoylglutathione lyase family enzyme
MEAKFFLVSLWAEDLQAAIHFYRDVVGLPLKHHPGDRPYFDLDGAYLVILKGSLPRAEGESQTRFPVVALTVDDLDAAVNRLRAHQVELPWGIEEGSGLRWVMIHDPAGNLIELVQTSR